MNARKSAVMVIMSMRKASGKKLAILILQKQRVPGSAMLHWTVVGSRCLDIVVSRSIASGIIARWMVWIRRMENVLDLRGALDGCI